MNSNQVKALESFFEIDRREEMDMWAECFDELASAFINAEESKDRNEFYPTLNLDGRMEWLRKFNNLRRFFQELAKNSETKTICHEKREERK